MIVVYIMSIFEHMQWVGDANSGYLRLLDQTVLPAVTEYLDCKTVQSVWDAIKRLSVRGAPAIGIAAAYGCVVGANTNYAGDEEEGGVNPYQSLVKAARHLKTSRPTAINLFWATDRMTAAADRYLGEGREFDNKVFLDRLLGEARSIHEEDRRACNAIGEHTLNLLQEILSGEGEGKGSNNKLDTLRLLTHCNAGALATGGIGTATAVMYLAQERGISLAVYADETRPLLQGARLTAYELASVGIDVTLITDSTAATILRDHKVDAVITGADRIAANGDAANKIGTYGLAVNAKYHNIPFLVAAPTSTYDMDMPAGDLIPIELRAREEITYNFGRSKRIAPAEGVKVYSPAFDVTPAGLITAHITEKGIIQPICESTVKEVVYS